MSQAVEQWGTKRVMALLLALATVGGGATYLSTGGVEHVAKYEGTALQAYPDPGTHGVPWTICRGHTKGVQKGTTATPEQCDIWYAEDLRVAETGVQSVVRVPMKQGEYDAAVSFVFNLGIGQFKKSSLLRLTNEGKRSAACNEYPKWKYANGMVLEGLVVRRYAEQRLCLQGGSYVYHPKA